MNGRTLHTVRLSIWPDGKQIVACMCPVGADHPPAQLLEPVGDGRWWLRYSEGWAP